MSVFENNGLNIKEIEINESKKPPLLFLIILSGFGFSAYFTGTTFVPSVANNIGPFELLALILGVISLVYFAKNQLKIHLHFTVKILLVILVIGVVSLPNLVDRLLYGGIQLLLLAYSTVLVLVIVNVILQFPSLFRILLRSIALGSLMAGVWITIEGITSNSVIGTGGPFRNRAHVGIYMTTSFWMLLAYFFWPGVSKFERTALFIDILFVLYAVAVSGRRSVYLSLFIGFGLLVSSVIFTRGSGRFKMPVAIILIGGFLFLLAQIGSQYVPQLIFFNERVGLIDDRLALVVGTSDEVTDEDNFALLQRDGMVRALTDHPFLGIGWGGFAESEYSPTGHEMHSTPQRFLSELGIIGFVFYMIYNLYLWFGSIRLFFRVRRTQYQIPALVFSVALWSLSISWAYNRSVTERTYWLLIILFVALETLLTREWAKQQKSVPKPELTINRRYQQPQELPDPSILPLSR